MEKVALSVWGDSVAKGILYDGKRYKLTRDGVDSIGPALGISVKNYSRFGLTTDKALMLYNKEIINSDSDYIVFELGGNDCDYLWREIAENPEGTHFPNTPLEKFSANLESMIQTAIKHGKKIVMTTLVPIYSRYYFDFITKDGLSRENILSWLGDVEHIYRHHERYSLAVLKLAAAYNLPVVDLRDAFLRQKCYFKLLCEDGIHPNEEGQKLIFQTITNFVNDMRADIKQKANNQKC